ncbi:MAG: T9SS type A sorting domain-containing protein, partial [Saprospiraceae bacterium]
LDLRLQDSSASRTVTAGRGFFSQSDEGIYIFDFDRETGILSNMVFADPPEIDIKYGGCAVSPNSRYLYLTNTTKIFQLDLTDPLNPSSLQLIGTYDGFGDPLPANFGYCQLGPDCKIYLSTGNATRVMHVIHNPDEQGTACNFDQHGLQLPSYYVGIPYFPNFRLGPPDNPGLPCSPVVSTINPPTPLPAFSVFPNPVSTVLKVVPNRQYSGPARLRLPDLTGRLVLERVFDPLAPASEVDVSGLAQGVYVYEVWCEGAVQRAGKVVKWE